MPATLVWGKRIRLESNGDTSGRIYDEVHGVDGGVEFLSWSSIAEVRCITEQYGISPEIWPVYPNCEVANEVPLREAQLRSNMLRHALKVVPSDVVRENHWLKRIVEILDGDNVFFVMV